MKFSRYLKIRGSIIRKVRKNMAFSNTLIILLRKMFYFSDVLFF